MWSPRWSSIVLTQTTGRNVQLKYHLVGPWAFTFQYQRVLLSICLTLLWWAEVLFSQPLLEVQSQWCPDSSYQWDVLYCIQACLSDSLSCFFSSRNYTLNKGLFLMFPLIIARAGEFSPVTYALTSALMKSSKWFLCKCTYCRNFWKSSSSASVFRFGLTCCLWMLEYLSASLLLDHLQPCCRLSGEWGFSAWAKSRLQILQQICSFAK